MSLDYTITSPAVISGSTSSEVSLTSNGNSISLITPSGLTTYNFVLPPNLGTQNQVLRLNSSLETEWGNTNTTGGVFFDFVEDTVPFTSTSTIYQLIPSMILTPPSGTYYCIFNADIAEDMEYAIFVDGVILNETIRVNRLDSGESVDSLGLATVNGSQSIEVRSRSLFGSSYDVNERILYINLVVI